MIPQICLRLNPTPALCIKLDIPGLDTIRIHTPDYIYVKKNQGKTVGMARPRLKTLARDPLTHEEKACTDVVLIEIVCVTLI